MSLKYYNPVTPSNRKRVSLNYKKDIIWKGSPLKKLVQQKLNTGGRNNTGKITSYHRGGGHKQSYRVIDFKRQLRNIMGTVVRIEYDPNRTSYIALISYSTEQFNYILAPHGLVRGDKIISIGDEETLNEKSFKNGNAMRLKNVPIGTFIHNIELIPGKGGQIVRSAGTFARLIKKDKTTSLIRLSSGTQITLSNLCFCTIGIVSKLDLKNIRIGKAGRSRWLNKRSVVRGVAMNPIDHPHGGGEGKTSGGRCSVTPWGILTKGFKTNRKKKNKK